MRIKSKAYTSITLPTSSSIGGRHFLGREREGRGRGGKIERGRGGKIEKERGGEIEKEKRREEERVGEGEREKVTEKEKENREK